MLGRFLFWLVAGAVLALAYQAAHALELRQDIRVIPGAADADARVVNVTADAFQGSGSSVAGYFTGNKFGKGAAFGLVAEVQDVLGVGPLWGLEVDAFSIGSTYPDTWLRRGLGVVVGVNQGRRVPTVIGWGIQVLPFYRDRENVRVNYGLDIAVPANIAAISVMAGERVCLESSGRVCVRFNPAANAVEIVNGERVLWSVPAQ